ncbi:succinate dehydrogenase assembly factor 2-B, mitochondrial-like [Argonauta hians]
MAYTWGLHQFDAPEPRNPRSTRKTHNTHKFTQCQPSLISKAFSASTGGSDLKAGNNETREMTQMRLMYQSRKRQMLKTGDILSTFATKHLKDLTEQQLMQYDSLLNAPINDWDIYLWVTGAKAPPEQFDNEIMVLLKNFVKNDVHASHLQQPYE